MINENNRLSNLQKQLLTLFGFNIPEEKLKEIGNSIANYLLKQSRDEADQIWEEKGYREDQLKEWLSK